MNVKTVAATWVILVGASATYVSAENSADTSIPVNIAGETLGVILDRLHSQYGFKFIYSPALGNRAGPHMTVAPLPASRAFAVVAAAYGGCAQVRDAVVVMAPCNEGDQSLGVPPVDSAKVTLGVAVDDVQSETKTAVSGVAVTDIFGEGSAYKAGLRVGDVITSYNGESIHSATSLRSMVGAAKPGDVAVVTVRRGEKQLTFNVPY